MERTVKNYHSIIFYSINIDEFDVKDVYAVKNCKKLAWETGKFNNLYISICKPSGLEYLRKWGDYYSIGDHCSIRTYTNVTDAQYVRLGNNVQLTNCNLFGHDGSIACLNRAFNKTLDRVGKIDIKDNVYIGHAAIILPNVTIGPNSIVGAGSVVTKTVPPNTIVAGNPAKPIGKTDALVKKLESQTQDVPWLELLKTRGVSGFDPTIEPQLKAMRADYFFSADDKLKEEPAKVQKEHDRAELV